MQKFYHSCNVRSSLLIYSRSKNKWFEGVIADIYIDSITNKEWFIAKYDGNKRKSILRLCKDIKPNLRYQQDNETLTALLVIGYIRNIARYIMNDILK